MAEAFFFSNLVILFTTFQGGIAGSSYSIYDLALELSARGHEVHFGGRKEMPLFQWMTKSKVQCHDVRFSGYLDIKSAKQLLQIVRENKIEFINAQSGIDRTVCVLSRLLYRNSARLVFMRRQQPIDEPLIKRWLHMRFSEGIICTSKAIHTDLVKKGYQESKLTIIPNGLSPHLFNAYDSDFRSRFLKENGVFGPVIGFVSRPKRQDLLIEVASLLPQNWYYLFVGIDKADVLLPDNLVSRAHFTGRIPREEAVKYYSCMDVNLLLTEAEGFGMTVLESMKFGVPMVATSVGGIKELIQNGENGYLIENSTHQLVETLQKVINEPERNRLIVRRGFETASQFPIQATAEKYEHYIKNTVK